ncbi:MAG TPA: preprotein translocase subunit YajC [Actinomycetaceae bacterium]|nr:preprotein translocase subunit YajC [Actinomycetaceae bacterium]
MDPFFLIIVAVFGLMMWMMSRGAKKQRQAAADLRNSLEVGTQVMTAGGFYGTIVDIDGDVITLESTPGVETLWKREAISAITEPPFAVEEEDEEITDVEVPDDASTLTEEPESPAEPEPTEDTRDDDRRA